jgi:hypothetical protein
MTSYTLVITRADASVYWTEHFNDEVSCDEWLAEEQTRPYWDKTWVATKTAVITPDAQLPSS